MPRKTRLFLKDTPQHVVIRGINDKVIFLDEDDYQAFLAILKALVVNIEIELHAYVLMPSYFQFLATPLYENSLSKFMQSLGRRYVGYFNKKYERRGTLWEGRYKSSLVETKTYLYEVMRFIESKPKKSKSYPYSSIHKNIFSKDDVIITPREEYSCSDYRAFFDTKREKETLFFVASSLEKQTITGSFAFSKRAEDELGVTLIPKKRGRPQKNSSKKLNIRKKMYSNLVLINKTEHKNLKVSEIEEFSFATDLKFIPVVSAEIGRIASDYPVVLSLGENPILGALVALDNKNLAISPEGKWYGSYIPAYLRKYPFALASSKKNPEQSLMLIDMNSSLVSDAKGERIFNEDGTQSDAFKRKIELVSLYEEDRKRTAQIIKVIVSSGILEKGDIVVGEGEERKSLVTGFQAVSLKRYNALDEEIKKSWKEAGITDFIEAHLKSLDSINNLFTLAGKQQA